MLVSTRSLRRSGTNKMESKLMRQLMRNFDAAKNNFSNATDVVRIELPGPLASVSIPNRVDQGELLVHR